MKSVIIFYSKNKQYLRFSRQFQASLFFERKKSIKTQYKRVPPLRSLCAQKIVVFVFFCFISYFQFDLRFCALNIFSCKKVEIVLITSNTILLTCTPIKPAYGKFICNFLHREFNPIIITIIRKLFTFSCDSFWTYFYGIDMANMT